MQHQVPENPVTPRTSGDISLVAVACLLITMYLVANIMAVKLISVAGLTFFDAGTITFPLAFMLGDVLTEIWGYKTARKIIFLAFFCNVLLVCMTTIGVYLPYPSYTADIADAYAKVFSYVPRIVGASLIGFLCGELANAWSMEKIKQATSGRHLWLRAIGSSMLGYMFDTVLFVLLAFGGTVPAKNLFTMIGFLYLAKVLLEGIGATPFTYLAVAWLRRH